MVNMGKNKRMGGQEYYIVASQLTITYVDVDTSHGIIFYTSQSSLMIGNQREETEN